MDKNKSIFSCIFIVLFLFLNVCMASPIQVGIVLDPPFVMENQGKYSGISIAIWETVAKAAKLNFEYQLFANEMAVIQAYKNKNIDVIVSPIPVTFNLIKSLSFSRPYFINTIGIISANKLPRISAVFKTLIHTIMPFLLVFLIVTVLFGLIMAIFEYYWYKKNWFEHFLYAFLNSLSALFSLNYIFYPKSKLMLFFSILWLLMGLSFISMFSATVTSTMLIAHTNIGLNTEAINEETNKHIAIRKFSPLIDIFKENKIQITYITTLEEGLNLLENKQVDSVIANYASIKYVFHNQLYRYSLQEFVLGSTELAFAVRDPKTLQTINEALTELQDKNEIYGLCKNFINNDAKFCLI
ncbi:substrate-binding periplasmic protein [Legionella oakridgensis]|uniref:ABC-type amino acid transport/signal transduction systems, periplasmic component/domain protein n=2 Tax=Legionella oakridgensis TaxID=29423 RepID=W0BHN6_9GAMM|nr:transporter substrate-binding domain-containing protein [Legionella oakridgensis]AHE68142.1 ABC-type amino acid transport/signal transduction systems, periplasmic component/domain protein [Legionella oakridgensis ATCC 33761 = DSM 21215]ETO92356.1 ABC-type amino acid transport/signal transduction system protein [Legionella oakridgensis RV-2-2007]KTD37271.1 glutamine ABC transporter periplasmic protein [Legionella oakridgensis]STY21111.1 glutamine ABC transporter periplasmic protein [Legionell